MPAAPPPHRRLRPRVVPLVAIGACALAPPPPAHAQAGPGFKLPWESVRWAVGCTEEYERVLREGLGEGWQGEPHLSDCDPDDPTSPAAATRYELDEASPWLRDLGFGGPRIAERDGERYVAHIHDYGLGARGACSESQGTYNYVEQILRVSPCFHFVALREEPWTLEHNWGDLMGLAPVHELFHAVQHGYSGMSRETEGTWIREGTAFLVQLAASRRGVTTLPYALPHRYYDDPLHIPRTTDKDDVEWRRWAYGSWYFWDYLGERFDAEDRIAFLDPLFLEDLAENNGLAGIETGLRRLGTAGLYDLYPAFVADRLTEPCFFESLGAFDRTEPGSPCKLKPSQEWHRDLGPGDSTRIVLDPPELAAAAFLVRTRVPLDGVARLRIRIPPDQDDPAYHLIVGDRRLDVPDPVTGRFPARERNEFRGAVRAGLDSVLVRVAHVPEDVLGVAGGEGLTLGPDVPVEARLEVLRGFVVYTGDIEGDFRLPDERPGVFAVITGVAPHPEACLVNVTLSSPDERDHVILTGKLPAPLRTGTFPVEDFRNRRRTSLAPAVFAIQARPSCRRIDCSSGVAVASSTGGTLELLRITEESVEGRFRAPVLFGDVAFHVSGHFVVPLGNVIGYRLREDHPCLPRRGR